MNNEAAPLPVKDCAVHLSSAGRTIDVPGTRAVERQAPPPDDSDPSRRKDDGHFRRTRGAAGWHTAPPL